MARIGILTCSNATQELGCSSVTCLRDMRLRKGAFEHYKNDEALDLIGIINCSGCPTLAGPEKLLNRIRALTEFKIDAIHFTYCIDALCPFKNKYKSLLEENFPEINIIIGTHESHITFEQFRNKVKNLLCQPRDSMVDLIKGRTKD